MATRTCPALISLPSETRLPLAFKKVYADGGRADSGLCRSDRGCLKPEVRRFVDQPSRVMPPEQTPKLRLIEFPVFPSAAREKRGASVGGGTGSRTQKPAGGKRARKCENLGHLADDHLVWSCRSLSKISGSGLALDLCATLGSRGLIENENDGARHGPQHGPQPDVRRSPRYRVAASSAPLEGPQATPARLAPKPCSPAYFPCGVHPMAEAVLI
jgi:hypothetical protein